MALLGALASLLAAGTSRADEATPAGAGRGPLEIRDDNLLAQPRLTLPALSPHPVPRGRWSITASTLWSNTFAWTQDQPGETPKTRFFLVDGETLTLSATVRRGLLDDLDVGVSVAVRRRGGGVLDGMIDAWHRLFGFDDGGRPSFLRDAFRASGLTTDRGPFSWTDSGTGLGDLEADVRWRVLDGGASEASLALVGRVSLPTATGPYAGNGLGAGAQAVLGVPLSRSFDLYAGAGATVQDPSPVEGVEYVPARGHGFVALEWRPWRHVSLLLETNAASRLVRNIRGYPGTHWLVNVGTRIDLGHRTRLDVGMTENIISQQSTTDLAFYFALGLQP